MQHVELPDLDVDVERTGLARPAVTSLAPNGVLGAVPLLRLQQFLWHELPIYWSMELELHLAVAAELGERFAAEGMDAHAAVCTCSQTEEIIWAYGTVGHDAGFAAYCEAIMESSSTRAVSVR